ncbi:MAG: DUF6463 family protein [Bacteroidota bacterium]
MSKRIGIILIVIGALHTLLGLVKNSSVFMEMIADGMWNTAQTAERGLAFWFTFACILFMILGYAVHYLERQSILAPKPLGWFLLGGTLLGVVFIPASGFWALLLPAILILSRKQA